MALCCSKPIRALLWPPFGAQKVIVTAVVASLPSGNFRSLYNIKVEAHLFLDGQCRAHCFRLLELCRQALSVVRMVRRLFRMWGGCRKDLILMSYLYSYSTVVVSR